MFNFCRHKWDKVDKGYQYCNKCGKARKVDCSHKWEIIEKVEIKTVYWSQPSGYLFTLQCKHCGTIRKWDHSYKDSYERILDKIGDRI